MLIISLKQEHSSQIRIGLSDGVLFSLKTDYLPDDFVFGDLPQEISDEEAAHLRFAGACLRAEKAAANLVANAEQTRFGLSRKLESRGHAGACVNAVMSLMEANNIVNDERFARTWVDSRLSRKADSPRSLLAALCNRGIDRRTAQSAIKSVLDAETELSLLKKFIAKNEVETTGRRQRLKYEGFSPDVIEMLEDENDS
jgi:regulatory protein